MEFGYYDTIKKTIINELFDSFYGLGIDVKDINLDINKDSVDIKICIKS